MTHEVIRHLLDDYVTGELTEDARAPVAEHVTACEICSAEVESLKRIIARAVDLPKSIEPPAEAWSNIQAAILRDENAGKSHAATRSTSFWRRPLVLTTAAAVVVAVLSSTLTALYLNARFGARRRPDRYSDAEDPGGVYRRREQLSAPGSGAPGSLGSAGNGVGTRDRRPAQNESAHDRCSDTGSAQRSGARSIEQTTDRNALGELQAESRSVAALDGDHAWHLIASRPFWRDRC